MALIRVLSRVEKDGKIKLPKNIKKAAGIKEGQVVELKIIGVSGKKSILAMSAKTKR